MLAISAKRQSTKYMYLIWLPLENSLTLLQWGFSLKFVLSVSTREWEGKLIFLAAENQMNVINALANPRKQNPKPSGTESKEPT